MTINELQKRLNCLTKVGIDKQCLTIGDIAEIYGCDKGTAGMIMQGIKRHYNSIPLKTRCTIVDYARWFLSGFTDQDIDTLVRLESLFSGKFATGGKN